MQIDVNSDNVYQEQTNIMEKLRSFAVNKNVHIHLVAHPRKTEKFQNRLTLFDVAGSSNLINKAYNIITITRKDKIDKSSKDFENLEDELIKERYVPENVSTVLEILKTKGNRCGLVGLEYDATLKTYKLSPKLMDTDLYKYEHRKKSGGSQECPF